MKAVNVDFLHDLSAQQCEAEGREEGASYRGQAAGSSVEPGRTTAALVSSIPCKNSPPSAASSPRSDGLRQLDVKEEKTSSNRIFKNVLRSIPARAVGLRAV